MHTAKQYEIPIFIVGHVNKDGAIAGPKVMEHIVDTVLYFEEIENIPIEFYGQLRIDLVLPMKLVYLKCWNRDCRRY